jgi:hypothetical protein
MASKRWSKDEKGKLLELYASGQNFEEIGASLDRSSNAIKLRIESIVYDNFSKGISLEMLTRLLKVDNEKLKQMYYSHKSFKEGRGETVVDINFDVGSVKSAKSKYSIFERDDNIVPKKIKKGDVVANNNKINIIEKENEVLEAVIKNYKMKKILRELHIDGKLDNDSLKICKGIIMKN